MKNATTHAAIDIGTSKVCTLVGHTNSDGEMQVTGVGLVPSRGMRKGMVSNLGEVQQVVNSSLREAEAQAGAKVSSAYVGITGGHINYVNSRACLDNRRYDSPVGYGDVEQVIQACYADNDSLTDKVIHVIPRDYSVDGNWGVKDPLGMYGASIEVESHVVTAHRTSIDNLTDVLRKSGAKLRGLVLEPLASAEAILSQDERDMGVVLVDIGGGTSDISVFLQGNIWHTSVLPVGGFQLTRDISIAFTTFFLAAEEAKIKHGNATPDVVDPAEELLLPAFGGDAHSTISRQSLCRVIRERMEELFSLILSEVKGAGLDNAPPGGLVITGGSAMLPGIDELAQSMWPGPVRIGVPTMAAWAPKELESPSFATALGLLLWGSRYGESNGNNGNGMRFNLALRYQEMLRQWMRNIATKVHA